MAVDLAIDGTQPPSSSRQDGEHGERGSSGSGRGATCRWREARGRLGGDGGLSGQQLGGGGVAGDGPQRWRGAVAELLAMELELLLRRRLGE